MFGRQWCNLKINLFLSRLFLSLFGVVYNNLYPKAKLSLLPKYDSSVASILMPPKFVLPSLGGTWVFPNPVKSFRGYLAYHFPTVTGPASCSFSLCIQSLLLSNRLKGTSVLIPDVLFLHRSLLYPPPPSTHSSCLHSLKLCSLSSQLNEPARLFRFFLPALWPGKCL